MARYLVSSLILATGMIVGGFLAGGRYSMDAVDAVTIVRLDRWTGDLSLCAVGAGGRPDTCEWDGRPIGNNAPPPSISANDMSALENTGLARPAPE